MKFGHYKLLSNRLKVSLLLSVIALFFSVPLSGQLIILGSGTATTGTSTESPINIFYESLHCQIVYTRAEINSAGVIGAADLNNLGFYIATAPNSPLPNWTIKMKHTTATNVATHDGVGLTTYLTIPSYMPAAGGFQMLNLATPFNWNGTDNILIDICFAPTTWSSSGTVRYYTTTSGFRSIRQDGSNQCGVNTTNVSTNKPQIQMDFSTPFPMVFDSVQALHPDLSSVLLGTTNAQILQAKVKTTGGLNPLSVSSLTLTTNGTTNPVTDITNAHLYYTGSINSFSTATQFGTAIANPNGTMTFNGSVNLSAGFSYFWLVYDVTSTATPGNVIDATLTSITVDNIVKTPSNGAPNGNRPIVNIYASIPHVEGFENTWINGSSTRDLPSVHWLNTPSSGNSSWRREDDGTSGGWSGSGGLYSPTGSNANNAVSSHSARFHSYDILNNGTGTLDLYLNFSPIGVKVLDFDVINSSGTDKLDILFSTDAGATFTPIGSSYGINTNWTRFKNITLSTSTSSTCVLRFKGTGDWGVTDIGLDNIYVRVPPPFDAGVVSVKPSLCDGHITTLIQNYGSQPVTGFNVTYVVSGGATVTENVGSLTIQPNQQASYTFSASVAGAGPFNIYAYTILTNDGLALNDTSPVAICYNKPLISTFPYFMDFESGQNGWSAGGTLSSWAFGKPAKSVINSAASGVKCWVNGGLTSVYNNNENSYVLGPCFDFSTLNNPIIKMKIWWDTEGPYDGAVLQSSTDGGNTWQTIGTHTDPMNWYNHNSIYGNPGGQGMGWTGRVGSTYSAPGAWVLAQHKLNGLAHQPSVYLRIAFGSDGSGTYNGFAFDDVYIGEGPVAQLPSQLTICSGDTILLDPGAFASYTWIPTNDSVRYLPVTAPGYYIVRVADADGFSDVDTTEVIGSTFTLDLGPKIFKCREDVVNINTNLSGFTYLWNDNSTGADINVTDAGFYSVTVTDLYGCHKSDTVEVAYYALPTVALGNDTTICGDAFIEMNAGNAFPGSTYLWSTGDTTQRLLVTAPGAYSVRITTIEGCHVSDTINIANIPAPVLNLGPDISQCAGLNVTLDAGNPNCTYLWSTSATTRTIIVTQAGTYSVKVTNADGCYVLDTIVVGIDPAAQISLGPDVQSCTPVTLDASANFASYIWSTGETTSSILATTSGTYIVQVGTAQGCIALDTVQVTIFPGLNAAIAVLDTVYLQDTVQFADATFPIPSAWTWNFGDVTTSNQNNPTHVYNTIGTYTVSLRVSKNGCIDSVTKDIVVVVKPVAVDPLENLLSFVLYPNPNKGQFQVSAEWAHNESGKVWVSDLTGKVIVQETFTNQTSFHKPFNISHLSAGYYFLTLQTQEGKITTKIVLY